MRTFVTENKVRYVFVACDVKRLVPALEEEMTKIQVAKFITALTYWLFIYFQTYFICSVNMVIYIDI